MKSAATYLKKTPDRTYAIRRRMGSATLTWLRNLDEKNRGLLLAVSVGITTGSDGVKCAIMNDFVLHDSYTVLDGKSLLETLHVLCAELRGCVPRGENFVVYLCNNGGYWNIYVDTGLGGTATVKRFESILVDYPQKPTDVFEIVIHNLEEVS